jgi:hypothetical protein
MKVTLELKNGRSLELRLARIKQEAEQALFQSARDAGQLISDHIKNDLLSGEMLYDTTNFPRAMHTNSLPGGALKKAIFLTPSQSGNQARVTVSMRGSGHLKEVAKWLIEGRTGPWQIPNTLPNPTGKALHMILRVGEKPENPEFDEKFSKSFDHPGYGSFPFMTRGLADKASYFRQLAQRMVRKATQYV